MVEGKDQVGRHSRAGGNPGSFEGTAVAIANPSRPRFAALPPLALYVHVPWCLKKCPYCDFNSHEFHGDPEHPPEQAYVGALIADLEQSLPSIWGRKLISVFIGGGTPSLLSPEAIDRLLAAIRARLPIMPEAEITLEANPGTFERARFEGFRAAGVNRLSLGVQSFNPAHLAALGRVHDADEARVAATAAMAIFPSVNLDLMFGLPGQTLAECEADVEVALSFRTPHLSFYQLTIEPNTRFHREPPALPDEDAVADMQSRVAALLAAHGYTRYEVSAYARPGRECVHNLNYWRFGDYLGIGAGAHGKLSFADRIVREVRYRQPKQYMEKARTGDPLMERSEIARADIGFEFMLNALRLTAGVPATLFAERTGYPAALVVRTVAEAEQHGLLEADPTRFVPTELGRRFLNDLVARFLPDTRQPEPKVDAAGRRIDDPSAALERG